MDPCIEQLTSNTAQIFVVSLPAQITGLRGK